MLLSLQEVGFLAKLLVAASVFGEMPLGRGREFQPNCTWDILTKSTQADSKQTLKPYLQKIPGREGYIEIQSRDETQW